MLSYHTRYLAFPKPRDKLEPISYNKLIKKNKSIVFDQMINMNNMID